MPTPIPFRTSKPFKIYGDLNIGDSTKVNLFTMPTNWIVDIKTIQVIAPPLPNYLSIGNDGAVILLSYYSTWILLNGNDVVYPAIRPDGDYSKIINIPFNSETALEVISNVRFDRNIYIQFPRYSVSVTGVTIMPLTIRYLLAGMAYIEQAEINPTELENIDRLTGLLPVKKEKEENE